MPHYAITSGEMLVNMSSVLCGSVPRAGSGRHRGYLWMVVIDDILSPSLNGDPGYLRHIDEHLSGVIAVLHQLKLSLKGLLGPSVT